MSELKPNMICSILKIIFASAFGTCEVSPPDMTLTTLRHTKTEVVRIQTN